MDINQLQQATEDLSIARLAHAEAEIKRHVCRQRFTRAEAALSMRKFELMASPDAGGNDAQRRAYAERETADLRERLDIRQSELDDADIAVIETAARLRIAEDRRRYLETVARIEDGSNDALNRIADALEAIDGRSDLAESVAIWGA